MPTQIPFVQRKVGYLFYNGVVQRFFPSDNQTCSVTSFRFWLYNNTTTLLANWYSTAHPLAMMSRWTSVSIRYPQNHGLLRSIVLTFFFLTCCYSFGLSTIRNGKGRSSSIGLSNHLFASLSPNDNDNDNDSSEVGEALAKRIKERGEVDLHSAVLPDVFKYKRSAEPASDKSESSSESSSTEALCPIIDYTSGYPREREDLRIPNRIVCSSVAWGDPKQSFVPGAKRLSTRAIKESQFLAGDVNEALRHLCNNGILAIETSTQYGAASSANGLTAHDMLGGFFKENPKESKRFMLFETCYSSPWFSFAKSRGQMGSAMVSEMEKSLSKRLHDMSGVEMYMVSSSRMFPGNLLCSALATVLDSGITSQVGVAGLQSPSQIHRINRRLKRICDLRNIPYIGEAPLAACSFDFSLTHSQRKRSLSLLRACKDEGVIPLCTDPLAGGLATGKFTVTSTARGAFSFKTLEKLQPLHNVQETVADRVGDRIRSNYREIQQEWQREKELMEVPEINYDITTTQVALQYVIAKGGVPVVPINTLRMAEEVTGCLGWSLTADEVNMLDTAVGLCR